MKKINMFLKKKWVQTLLFIGAIGVSIGMLFFVVSSTIIGFQMKEYCADAQQEYGGECVDALLMLLKDEKKSFSSRNSAIWALGQLGDEKAIPVLKSYINSIDPLRGDLDRMISQYSLFKAIKLINGINLTAWAWR